MKAAQNKIAWNSRFRLLRFCDLTVQLRSPIFLVINRDNALLSLNYLMKDNFFAQD